MPRPDYVYWDACVFLSHLDQDQKRSPDIDGVLKEIEDSQGTRKIATSIVSKVEVAFVENERQAGLSDDIEQTLDDLWSDDSQLEMVELHEFITRKARALMRQCVAEGKPVIKPLDAIHVATAEWLGASELHTYDTKLLACAKIGSMAICQPRPTMPRLPGVP